jgi:signal peptidase I
MKKILIKCAVGLVTLVVSFQTVRNAHGLVKVEGKSMYPTLHDEQTFQAVPEKPSRLTRGTIIVLNDGIGGLAVKRIVGLPGETVQFHRGDVYINGLRLEERYLPDNVRTYGDYRLGDKLKAGKSQYIVLGDNRKCSYDSRMYGDVPIGHIHGILEMATLAPVILKNSPLAAHSANMGDIARY